MIHHIRRASSVSSSAIILSALITTIGVITAACIQTGWLVKPVSVSSMAPARPVQQARFTGMIMPIHDEAVAQAQFKCDWPEQPNARQPAGYFFISDEDLSGKPPRTADRANTDSRAAVALRDFPACSAADS